MWAHIPVMAKCFFLLYLLASSSFSHYARSISHNACWPMNLGFTTVYWGCKKRINMEKSLQRHLWRQNSEVSAMYGKGAKKPQKLGDLFREGKNPSCAICEADTDIRTTFGRKGLCLKLRIFSCILRACNTPVDLGLL